MLRAAVIPLLLAFTAVTGPAEAAPCVSGRIATAEGCQRPAAVRQHLTQVLAKQRSDDALMGLIVRVDIDGRTILRRGFGRSQVGVPARGGMHFRIGSMTIPVLTTVVYRLREQGRLRLNDPISRWLPEVPRAKRVTVRQLMNNTSGYRDWIQGNDDFVADLYRNPFRKWTQARLQRIALGRGFACKPGSCFSYAHTNYLLLGRIVREVAPERSLKGHLREVLGDIDLRFSRLAPIPAPALSAYTPERGVFEESTGWSPSWGLGNGMLATATIDDVAGIAKQVLSGRTLSRWSRRDMVRSYIPAADASPRQYFAQGLIVSNGWRRQNPFFNGYMGNVAWFPKERISVALVGTRGRATTREDNVTNPALGAIADYLTPDNDPLRPVER